MALAPKVPTRRFSSSTNPWSGDNGNVPESRPRVVARLPPPPPEQECVGLRGRTLVIHARPDHPLRSRCEGGATLAELLRRLLQETEDGNKTFRRALLTLHSMFVTSAELLHMLGALFYRTNSKLTLVHTIQKWVKWFPADFAEMKMRFTLRELFLQFSREGNTALQKELQATLRVCDQAHAAFRPPSYYTEQSVKTIEAALPKRNASSRALSEEDKESKSPTNSPSVHEGEAKAPSIHDTLKAQNYDPFDNLHGEDADTDEPASPNNKPVHVLTRQLTISSPTSPKPQRHWKGSEYLFDLPPAKVCNALTVLDHINLKAIKLREFINKQWTRPDAPVRAPNLTGMIDQYNARSYWVAAEILVLRQPAQRIKAMRFFIELARECASVKNYFAVFAIIHGLNQSPLFRLKTDWDKLPKASKACLSNLKTTITEPSGNSKAYRAIKSEALIPHLAHITKLLVALDELPLYAKGPEVRVNFDRKVYAIYNALAEVRSCQKLELKITQDGALLELLGRLSRSLYDATTSIKLQDMWTLSFIYLPKTGREANVIPMYGSEGTRASLS